MASAQVLPSPGAASARKQGHLEAGKRRLEEFRKKKAARKASSTGQFSSSNSEVPDTFSNEGSNDHLPSDGFIGNAVESSGMDVYSDGKRDISAQPSGHVFINRITNATLDDSGQTSTKDKGYGIYGSSSLLELNSSSDIYGGSSKVLENTKNDRFLKIQSDLCAAEAAPVTANEVMSFKSRSQGDANSTISGSLGNHNIHYNISDAADAMGSLGDSSSLKEQVFGAASRLADGTFRNVTDDPYNTRELNQEGQADNTRVRISDAINRRLSAEGSASVMSEYSSGDSDFGLRGSAQFSFPSRMHGNTIGRSRPSFLDTINVSSISSAMDMPLNSVEVDPTALSKISSGEEVQLISAEQSLVNTDKNDPCDNHYDNAVHDLKFPSNRNDDFSALEQHIEDLTREKFSLQRALEASQSLSGSLASENSSLTESYNQQGKLVSQLKSEMERLQDEIKTQLVAFESLKLECANIRLECNAADEREKILATEVINLEEKALRLRSNELKLEKQLEKSNVEITSYKKKLSSLEKERNDFTSTIEALQEEKKLLQGKLRKASTSEKSKNIVNVPMKKDVCTSTDDLCESNEVVDADFSSRNPIESQAVTSALAADVSTSSISDISGSYIFPETVGAIPVDHIRMIDNINSLLSELKLEKEALKQSLTAESSLNRKLKDTNNELSRKLEAQTQRFELLAAQNVSVDSIPLRRLNSGRINEVAEYTDEGDEVVERVLGWIMKLFPGGPGKRRASRLL